MSLILEALRKSEAERRRGQAPGVATELPPLPAARAAAFPRWAWALAALALAVVLALAWQARRPAPAAAANPQVAAEHSAPVGPATPAVVPRVRAAAPVPDAGVEPAPPVRTAPASPPVAPAAASPRPRPMSGPPPDPRPAPAPAAIAPEPAAVPDIAATALPPVRLSMHMWDADPARRFVIVDGRRMQEGDRSGGLEVVEIRRDGVVVERDGQRARVPLP